MENLVYLITVITMNRNGENTIMELNKNVIFTTIDLLTVSEFKEYSLEIPPLGREWWLRDRTHDQDKFKIATVYPGGMINLSGRYPDNTNIAARPVLRGLFTNVSDFTFAGHKWLILNENLAICEDFFRSLPFNSIKIENISYEKSDIALKLYEWYLYACDREAMRVMKRTFESYTKAYIDGYEACLEQLTKDIKESLEEYRNGLEELKKHYASSRKEND